MKLILTIALFVPFLCFSQDFIFYKNGRISEGLVEKYDSRYLSWSDSVTNKSTSIKELHGFKFKTDFYEVFGENILKLDNVEDYFEATYYFRKKSFDEDNIKYLISKHIRDDFSTTINRNFDAGYNEIMTGGIFILLSGSFIAASVIHTTKSDVISQEFMIVMNISSIATTIVGGAFIISGSRKNKIRHKRYYSIN